MTWQRHFNAAEGYLDLGMPNEAAEELDLMPAKDKGRPEVFALWLIVYQMLEKWDLAVPCAELLSRVWPDQPGWRIGWANAVRHTVGVEAAERILGEALPRFSQDAGMLYHLARVTAVQGRVREARLLLADAFRRDSSLRELAIEEEDLEAVWGEIEK